MICSKKYIAALNAWDEVASVWIMLTLKTSMFSTVLTMLGTYSSSQHIDQSWFHIYMLVQSWLLLHSSHQRHAHFDVPSLAVIVKALPVCLIISVINKRRKGKEHLFRLFCKWNRKGRTDPVSEWHRVSPDQWWEVDPTPFWWQASSLHHPPCWYGN